MQRLFDCSQGGQRCAIIFDNPPTFRSSRDNRLNRIIDGLLDILKRVPFTLDSFGNSFAQPMQGFPVGLRLLKSALRLEDGQRRLRLFSESAPDIVLRLIWFPSVSAASAASVT